MVGAVLGDIIGSVWEYMSMKSKEFPLLTNRNFVTDDSILTIAIFCALEKCNGNYNKLSAIIALELLEWGERYLQADWGSGFLNWLETSLYTRKVQPPYNSCGNGSAMRVSPVAYFANSIEECKELAYKVSVITHNHVEGIKGAEATVVATYMALHGSSQKEIGEYISANYYLLNESCDEIRKYYKFEPTCQGTVPQSIQAFLEASSYEDAIRNAISLGGDADTLAAITGAIAEAYFGIPLEIENKINYYLDEYCEEVFIRMVNKRNIVRNSIKSL